MQNLAPSIFSLVFLLRECTVTSNLEDINHRKTFRKTHKRNFFSNVFAFLENLTKLLPVKIFLELQIMKFARIIGIKLLLFAGLF